MRYNWEVKHNDLLTEEEQDTLYLIHHMHHFKRGNKIVHELHHCPLFSQKNMEGEKFNLDHLTTKNKLYHIVLGNPPTTLYDHQNNIFKITSLEHRKKKYCQIK